MYSIYLNEPIDGTPTSVQVVYTSHEVADFTAGIAELVESYNRRLPPSRILFVCPCGLEQRIRERLTDRDAWRRLVSTSHVVVAPYGSDGTVVLDRVLNLKEGASDWKISDDYVHRLALSTVGKIVDATKTILYAPHGYHFLKPSGREEAIFVRAGNMLREPGSLSIFNFLLLRWMPPNCRSLYIDSFTILSFALGLKSLVRYFQESDSSLVLPIIENIHSYEISPEFRVPNDLNYFVVISASTSGGLAGKLVEERQAHPDRIVHLLGVAEEGSALRKKCVYFRALDPWDSIGSDVGKKEIIEISTEEFLVAQGSPRPVRITQRLVNRLGAKELGKEFYRGAMKFYDPRPSAGTGYSTFSLSNDEASYSSSPIREWIEESLVHELPASVRMLVHLDDPMSALVANSIEQTLGRGVSKYSLGELSSLRPRADRRATVAVAYQDPDLEGLRRANVMLRDWGDAHRHYLVCYAFPSSDSEHRRLKDDLRMGPGGVRFGWSEFLVLPVGASSLHESFALEGAAFTVDALAGYRGALGVDLATALGTRCGRSEVPSDGLFLPKGTGAPLQLRPNSIFFNEGRARHPVSQICVYAMVAAAIQQAREAKFGYGGTGWSGFDENPFVRSVLDPSMFVRFNDGILQAALLRASRSSELDYSASDEFSRQFAATCRSVFLAWDQDVGDAAVEFVHALVAKKVALRRSDREQLFDEIGRNAVLKAMSVILEAGGDEGGLN